VHPETLLVILSEESPRNPGAKRFFVVPLLAGLLRMTI
jgi:hypothetical protein